MVSAPHPIPIFYLTGTGNTRRLAREIAAEMAARGRPAEARSLEREVPAERLGGGRAWPAGFSGLCYPTHCFNAPWPILKLLWSMPPGGGREIFRAGTRTGLPWGRRVVWGVSGLALWLPWLLLHLKGYRVRGVWAADLPSNWVTVHPGMKPGRAEAVFSRQAPQLAAWVRSLVQGRRAFPAKLFLGIIPDLLVLPLALAGPYAAFGLGRLFMASRRCTGCGRCAARCPQKAVRLRHGRPYWTWRCLSCMRCLNICPEKAVYVMHPALAAVLLIGLSGPGPYWLWLLASPTLLGLAYPILFILARFGPFGRLWAWASLTSHWRHYLAPEGSLNASEDQKSAREEPFTGPLRRP